MEGIFVIFASLSLRINNSNCIYEYIENLEKEIFFLNLEIGWIIGCIINTFSHLHLWKSGNNHTGQYFPSTRIIFINKIIKWWSKFPSLSLSLFLPPCSRHKLKKRSKIFFIRSSRSKIFPLSAAPSTSCFIHFRISRNGIGKWAHRARSDKGRDRCTRNEQFLWRA